MVSLLEKNMLRKMWACLPLILLQACVSVSVSENLKTLPKTIVPAQLQSTYDSFQYAPAVKAGDFIYLSGVVASVGDDKSPEALKTSIEAAFDEIDMILEAADTDWDHVVDVTAYLTDLEAHLGPLWEVKGRRVSAPFPAWTAIGVDSLYGGDGAIIEIKVTAYHPQN